MNSWPGSSSPSCSGLPAKKTCHPLTLRLQPGYDHSYYLIASFIGEHLAHHVRALKPL